MKRKNPQQNDISNNIVSISDISKEFETNKLKTIILELEQKHIALGQALDKALKSIEEKQQEISHLKSMLQSTVPVIGRAEPILLSDEEMISEMQLKQLKDTAMLRSLTLEEVKKFDLLVKNKRLAQGNPTNVIEAKKIPQSKDELLLIASQNLENKDEHNE